MAKPRILEPGKSYSFRNYFEMSQEPDEILAELGVALHRVRLQWPPTIAPGAAIATLKTTLQNRLPYVSLTSEAARREVLIAPILLALVDHTQAQLRIEYTINVSEQLKGSLDYYLQSQHNLLVIEAKNADLARGFTQLAVELIALDRWLDPPRADDDPWLYGAVSTGDLWQFGRLDRQHPQIQQDLDQYRVPADLDALFPILLGILQRDRPSPSTRPTALSPSAASPT